MPKISKTRSHLTNSPSRRAVLSGLLATAALPALPRRALALSTSEAEALIGQVVADVLKIVNNSKSEAQVFKAFEGIFTKYADVPRIAASILGPPWRSASKAERQAYIAALTGYLARKYGRQFREAKGARFEITKSSDFGRKGIVVSTIVSTDVYAPYPVEWHVIDAGGRVRFFDMIVEGIKLLSTEKSEVRAVYDRTGSMAGLTATLLKMG